jgi:excinuclease UvrABC nuclease subunit
MQIGGAAIGAKVNCGVAYNEAVLTERLEFSPGRDAEIFSAAPAAPAVFLLRSHDAQAEPYVSKTANLRRRLQRLLGAPDDRTRRLNLRDRIGVIEYAPTGSDFESGFTLYKILRSAFPRTYSNRLRLRAAPLVKLHLENKYPRASVTTRLGKLNGPAAYYGPFASRNAAEKFMNDSLDFFRMRRCVDDLNPDPAFPGCIYSEMKMCLAPCFKGCGEEEYSAEVARVRDYFDSGGESLAREFFRQRDAASSDLAFEDAAAMHARLEKLKPVISALPEIVGRLDRLSALMVQPSHLANAVTFFPVEHCVIRGPATFCIQTAEHAKSQSMEARVLEVLQSFPPGKTSALETTEHLALLKRWFYRSRRAGEIFLADDRGNFPMRRVVRGIGRVLRGEGPEPGAADQPARAGMAEIEN